MRRKRFQRGTLGVRKHGRVRVWVAQWWENGSHRSKVLGRCVEMTRSAAEIILAAILRPINEGMSVTARPVMTFQQFVEKVYLPHCRRTWKASTEMTSTPVIMGLAQAFGDRLLTGIPRDEMQDLLE